MPAPVVDDTSPPNRNIGKRGRKTQSKIAPQKINAEGCNMDSEPALTSANLATITRKYNDRLHHITDS